MIHFVLFHFISLRGRGVYFYTAYVARAGVIGILEARMRVGDGNQICFVLSFYFHVRVRIRVYI